MADTFEQLLGALGFNVADAGYQAGQVERKLGNAKESLNLQREDDTEALKAQMEARGVLHSGETNVRQAKLQGRFANASSALDIGAADDLYSIQRQLQQQKAQHEAELAQRAQQSAMFNESMSQSNRQLSTQEQMARDEQAAQANLQTYLGGLLGDPRFAGVAPVAKPSSSTPQYKKPTYNNPYGNPARPGIGNLGN